MAISKQIEGYPDYYVSSAGNVWREKSNESYLRLRPSKLGEVNLCTNGKVKQLYVHRLVAQAFVPLPEQYQGMSIDELDVHHINFNHFDNRASNLQWLTKQEHKKLHSDSDVTKKRMSETKKGIIPKANPPKQVAQYNNDGEFIAGYASAYEAERMTNVNHGNICKCCSGKRNYAGGYKWRYAD